MKKTAILGGTSHIAKGLIYNFLKSGNYCLYLFVRSPERMKDFLDSVALEGNVYIKDFSEINNFAYDVIINCVGLSGAADFKDKVPMIFNLTEKFDEMVLDYLKRNSDALYINFSSGAVFGTIFDRPVDQTTLARWDVNNITEKDYYGIAKLNSEAKHRSCKNFNIVDLRIYGYFSRFIDLSSKYLLTEIINCLKQKKEFLTDNIDVVRDYVHPEDLFSLVEKSVDCKHLNDAFDVYSLKPVRKFEIVDYFASRYGLKYSIREDIDFSSVTGIKYNYFSLNRKAQEIGYYPKFTSLESIALEVEKML